MYTCISCSKLMSYVSLVLYALHAYTFIYVNTHIREYKIEDEQYNRNNKPKTALWLYTIQEIFYQERAYIRLQVANEEISHFGPHMHPLFISHLNFPFDFDTVFSNNDFNKQQQNRTQHNKGKKSTMYNKLRGRYNLRKEI